MTSHGIKMASKSWHGGKDGVRSTEYGVQSKECVVYLSKSVSLDLAAILKQTPFFPLYGGIEWKTRSLSLKRFFRFGGDFKTGSVFSTLWGHKVENAESVFKPFL